MKIFLHFISQSPFLVTNKKKNEIRIPTQQKSFQTQDLRYGRHSWIPTSCYCFLVAVKFCRSSAGKTLLICEQKIKFFQNIFFTLSTKHMTKKFSLLVTNKEGFACRGTTKFDNDKKTIIRC